MRLNLLAAYDEQLRTDAETTHALAVSSMGPIRLAVFPGGRGFVSYANLGGADAARAAELVDGALEHFRGIAGITSVEWKTRSHDHAPGLHDALVTRGFVPEDTESIMIGEAALPAGEVAVPDGVELRRARTEAEVLAMAEMQGIVFEDPHWLARAE
ncbi:GNAT family N-acetyltransferase, partial [Microbacterium sp. ISL-103]|nr:GNAT family N-acetyltransferase [Microbacterium sp. ISL-103]